MSDARCRQDVAPPGAFRIRCKLSSSALRCCSAVHGVARACLPLVPPARLAFRAALRAALAGLPRVPADEALLDDDSFLLHAAVVSLFFLPGNMSQSPSSCSSLCAGSHVVSPGFMHGMRSQSEHPQSIAGSHNPSYPFSVSHAAVIVKIEQGLAVAPSEVALWFSVVMASNY